MSATPGHRVPDLGRARLAGRELGVDIDIAAKLRPFERHRWRSGDTPHPTLQLDDVSGIPFLVDIAGVDGHAVIIIDGQTFCFNIELIKNAFVDLFGAIDY